MGVPGSANPMLLAGGAAAYEIDQSLRFDGSAYLSRSLGTTSSSWTVSFWTKTALNDSNDGYWFNTSQAAIYMDSSSGAASDRRYKFRDATSGSLIVSNAVIRDPSAWYHVVYKCDGSNRRLYINNSLDAGFTYSGSTTLSGSCAIGAYYTGSGSQLEGYIAEFHFVDGSALDPSSFAEPDPDTGAWIPKRYSGSYGTNGFYLKFDPTATNGIGHDHSGNGNNFTATGFTTSGTGTDVMSDTPTTNWCTLNPLETGLTLSNGNLDYTYTSSNKSVRGTVGASSGKFRWEVKVNGNGNSFDKYAGIIKANNSADNYDKDANEVRFNADAWGVSSMYGGSTGVRPVHNNTLGTTFGWTWTAGDVLGLYLDATNGTLKANQNGGTLATVYTGLDTTATWLPLFSDGSAASSTDVVNFGQRAFEYSAAESGYLPLNTANLPEPTIKDGGKHFNTVLWSGNGATDRDITGVGFAPDLVWAKDRSGALSHVLQDRVRGAGNTILQSNNTGSETAQGTSNGYIDAFTSDGFETTSSTANQNYYFNSGSDTYVAWNWKAGGTGSTNTAGSITSTVSANASAGFSIVTWTGNGTAGATIGHGLGVKPSMFIVKCRDLTGCNWDVYHSAYGATKYTILNGTNSASSYSGFFNNTEPTSTLITLGSDREVNQSSATYVAYCFSEVAGYSKFGSFSGGDGVFVYLGFRPAFIMVKDSQATYNWVMLDSTRNTYNQANSVIHPNLANAESNQDSSAVDFLSNGFKVRGGNLSGAGNTVIYAAFAELPFKYANAR